jgi:hypothetical protein
VERQVITEIDALTSNVFEPLTGGAWNRMR